MPRLTIARFVLLVLVACLAPEPGDAQEATQKPVRVIRAAEPPAEMARLDFLIGTWLNTAVFLDSDGKEVGSFDAATDLPGGAEGNTIAPALGGWILESGAGTQYARTWFRYDPWGGVYMLAAADFQGNFDVLAGAWVDDELVFSQLAPNPTPDGGTIMWRWSYYDMQPDSYRLRQSYSRDGGESWILANRQFNRRLGDD